MSQDESFAQQTYAALRRLLAHESLSKPFDSSQTSKVRTLTENARDKRTIWPNIYFVTH